MAEEEKKQEEQQQEQAEQQSAQATAEAGESKEWSSDIKKLGDEIVELSLMQAKELGDYLKEVHGIEPAGGAPVMMAGAGGAGGEEEAEEEKTSFDVVLKEFGDKKIQVIKEVRGLTGLGLKEAKELVEGAPKAIKEGVSKEEADQVKEKLEGAGAVIEIS